MSKYSKPDVSKVWAETGTKTEPLDSKKATGWIVEKPKFENMNWIQNRQDSYLRYINQLGIPEWDAVTQYIANQSYVQSATTGIVYRCKTTHGGVGNTPQNPDADTTFTYWTVAFDASGSAATVAANLATLTSNYANLTGVNAGNGRTSLSVYSKAEIDSKIVAASDTTAGISKSATQAIVDAGTDHTAFVAADTLAATPATAKAFVRFDATSPTPTIAKSFNVASVSKIATGKYRITFTNAITNPVPLPATYQDATTGGYSQGSGNIKTVGIFAITTTYVDVYVKSTNYDNNGVAANVFSDSAINTLVVF